MGESNSNYGNANFSEEIVEESLREVWNALCEFPYLEASFSWNMIAYFERTTHESWDNLMYAIVVHKKNVFWRDWEYRLCINRKWQQIASIYMSYVILAQSNIVLQ